MTGRTTAFAAIAVSVSVLLVTCGPHEHAEEHAGMEDEAAIEVTRWTERTELFMEYPPLVAGERATFAIHLTDLVTFLPVTEGRVGVRFAGPAAEESWIDAPSTPGIFPVELTVPPPGEYQVTVALHGPLQDAHVLDGIMVYADADTAGAAAPEEADDPGTVFLKEQQWVLDFATARTETRPLRATITVPAEIAPRVGGAVEVRAVSAGRVATGVGHSPGTTISEGETLVELVTRNPRAGQRSQVVLELTQAEVALHLAQEDRSRAERLVEAGAAPHRRLAESQAAERIAAAQVERLQEELRHLDLTRTGAGAGHPDERLLVRAPITGVVAESRVTPGATVSEGELLFRLVAMDRVHVVGAVPEHQLSRLTGITGAEIVISGMPAALRATRLVSIGRIVDHDTRTVPIIFDLAAPPPSLAIGQAVSLRLLLAHEPAALAVPRDAIVDDGGQPVVFVQMSGERFERRPVRPGAVHEGGLVEIREGLRPGERVVTRGAHLVRLAALSPQAPAHGHVH